LSFIGSGGNYDLTKKSYHQEIAQSVKSRVMSQEITLNGATSTENKIIYNYLLTKHT
jgi:hypothetical protein